MKKPYPKGSVCKPCWELKYCPYGILVEEFPLFHVTDKGQDFDTTARYNEVLADLAKETHLEPEEVHDYHRMLLILNPESNAYIAQYEPEDVACRIFGHTCPVFFVQSGATETKEGRREGRYVPREVMFKVVRRDNHVCQSCHTYVRDDEVEFDHIIPLAKGGPTSVDNLRLLCRACNRKKSSALDQVLDPYHVRPKKPQDAE